MKDYEREMERLERELAAASPKEVPALLRKLVLLKEKRGARRGE